ncbi:MAG: L-threonylcarbamoyladenylate synthase [Synechococcales cyanobacterium T60_A2020_003]|nr:L-threonylcarbamoyladenylate synthase [Synechococcales cyanobacterium T60_A2020_003]
MPQVSVQDWVDKITSGQYLGSFPTDTVPALASRPDAAHLIYEAKQRSQTKPLILMGASIADLMPYVQGSPSEAEVWQRVMNQYFPGALTLVLPASDRLPRSMNPLDPTTIGIRVPDRAIARYLLAQTGPLATTSANRSGEPALQTQTEIEAAFPEVFTLPLDVIRQIEQTPETTDTPASSGIPSTVAKWTGQDWYILRQGAVTVSS